MENEDLKNFKLAIYLLKDTIIDFKDAIKENAVFKEYDFNDKMKVNGKVLIGLTKKSEPNWKILIQEGINERLPHLNNTSNRAIVFFIIDNSLFAIPFGYGKHLLKDDCIDREFGLKTALNIINADKLLSIDKANIGDLSVLTKTQASKKGTPDYFNIDIIKDLLRSITGEPTIVLPNEYGNVITGNEGIYISPKTDITKIPDILKKLKQEYKKTTYKLRFDWIDNIKTERDPTIIESLKNNLINELKNNNSEAVHLAPPFIVNWENFIGISFTPNGEFFNEFDIQNYYSLKKDNLYNLDWDKLMRQKLYLKESDNEDAISFNLWRFLNFETEYNGNNYVFTLSNWYRVNSNYYKSIYEYCSKIEESSIHFLDCNKDEDEGKYNERFANSNPEFICLDKKLIRSDISRSEIEACDIFTKSREFIHVKFRESSSTLSHLFAQGRISSNSLRRDRTFRINLRSKIKSLGLSSDLITLDNNKFNPSDYTITYAIIEKKKRRFVDSLPFFSLINFRLTAEDLILLGYNVKVKKIEIK
ncbi:MAG TPA: hypothetical protein DCG75_14750 [Bacteroidales bacterium]|nr:hypothetical protein [Bacteroidales bacterium]